MSCKNDCIRSSVSLVSQSDHRIHAHRSPRRDVAGKKRYSHQNDRDTGKCDRVGYADRIELARHQPRETKRREYADAGTKGRKPRALADDHAQNIFALRAERHAYADFIHALAYEV